MKDRKDYYSIAVIQAIGKLLTGEDGDYEISEEELKEGNNLTDFIHVIANVAPCALYSQFTGDDVNMLDFNHIANKLVFQNLKKEK